MVIKHVKIIDSYVQYVSFYVIQKDNILFNKLGALTHSILLSTDASPCNGDEYEQELGLSSPSTFPLK